MTIDINRVIVEDAVCANCSVHAKRVHHREFPEIRAECGSVDEAVSYLITQLKCARENAQSNWHHELIDRAIADATKVLETLLDVGKKTEADCSCPPHVLGQEIQPVIESHGSSL